MENIGDNGRLMAKSRPFGMFFYNLNEKKDLSCEFNILWRHNDVKSYAHQKRKWWE